MTTDRKVTAMEQYYEMQVAPLGFNQFCVHSRVTQKDYEVDLARQTCSCPDHRERAVKCKHIFRVELEGYQVEETGGKMPPSYVEKTTVQPDPGFEWFNMLTQLGAKPDTGIFMVHSGQRKQFKFWGGMYTGPGQKVLVWGDFNWDPLLENIWALAYQTKQVDMRMSLSARAQKKEDKGYYDMPSDMQYALMAELGLADRSEMPSDRDVQPEPARAKKKAPKIDWTPKDGFEWF